MSIRDHPVWTLVGSLILCLCVSQMSHAVGTFDVSNIFTLDTREGSAFGLSNLFTLDTRAGPSFGLSDIFVLDTREPGSNVGYSDIFALDTREPGSNVGYSSIFVLDTREPLSNVGYSDIFVLDTREPLSNVGYSNIFVLDTREVPSNVGYSDIFVLDTREIPSNVGYSNAFVLDTRCCQDLNVGYSDIFVLDTRDDQHNVGYSNIFVLDTRGILFGDVSDNGQVTAYDAAMILQHTVELITLIGREAVAADVTGNGAVTAYDASLVLQYVVSKITRFPVEEPVQARVVASSRTVGIPRVGSTSEGHLTVPVAIDDTDGVLSGEFVVVYASENVEALSVASSALLSGYLMEHNIADGKVLVSFAGAESGVGSGDLLEVRFRPVGEVVDALSGIRLERVQLNEGQVLATLANDGKPDVPTAYALHPNYPNPFNPETTIRYGMPLPGRVTVVVYNLSGQKIQELVSGLRDAGHHTVVWDGRDDRGREVGSGVYLCQLVAGRHEDVRRMVLVK